MGQARGRAPNLLLRSIRENERGETREQFAEAMATVARDMGYDVIPDPKYVESLESGRIAFPGPTYRNILSRLCGRPLAELGFRMPAVSVTAREANSRLRDAMFVTGIETRQLARKVGVDPKSVERWMTRGVIPHAGHRYLASKILGLPESELWPDTARMNSVTAQALDGLTPVPALAEQGTDDQLIERLRRTFLAGGLSALVLPALGLDELRHITAAVINAQRYADGNIAYYFRRQLESSALTDGKSGPRQSLPVVLGIIAAIEKMATDAKPAMRRDLLRIGAHASEFAGWLYRDLCVPELANYWRDRAIEWAQVSGDAVMQGYVLLKKSQAVWDERDALRMLTLAEAVQEGPWRLPPRVRAEAAQQQARGLAMLNGDLVLMESKLSEARSLLDQDRATSDARAKEVTAHYDEALFGLQVAICYCEARQPERSLELYERWLSLETFSRRDYGYFLALKGAAHAMAEEPEDAAMAGLEAFSFARETESVRTIQEVTRLAVQLDQWRDRESVHDLRRSVLVG